MKKKTSLLSFITFLLLLSISSKVYTQTFVDPATITDSSFKAFLPKWETYIDSISSGNPTLVKANASHTDDITIMGAFGGYEKGWVQVGTRYDWAAAQMKGSQQKKSKIEYIDIIVSGDLAYTVALASTVQGYTNSEKDPKLRVTEIFRKENGAWKLMHRHADPLTEKKAPNAPLKK